MSSAACGGFTDEPGAPIPLATVPVRLQNNPSVALRVALVWEVPFVFHDAQGAQHFGFARRVGVEQAMHNERAPAGGYFLTELKVQYAPPAYKPIDVEYEQEGLKLADGYLVAYEDVNGNGALDLLDEDATAYVDRIYAASAKQRLMYVQNQADSGNVVRAITEDELRDGFGVYEPTTDAILEHERHPLWAHAFGQQGLDSYVPLDVFNAAKFQYELRPLDSQQASAEELRQLATLSCAADPVLIQTDVWLHGAETARPHLAGEQITCYAQGAYYDYKGCVSDVAEGPCRGAQQRCYRALFTTGEPRPADWPCTYAP